MILSKNNWLAIFLTGISIALASSFIVNASEDAPLEMSEEDVDEGEKEVASDSANAATEPPSIQAESTDDAAKPNAENADENAVLPTEVAMADAAAELPVGQTDLEILGSSVVPGEAAILKWVFEATFVDTSAPVPVLVVNGVNPGPTLCVTAAVHGDELNGIEVVRRVVHEIDPEKLSGAVIGVPIVNLQGFRRANRYLPDRRDLNRYFPGRERGSYASRIAHSFFTEVVTRCNYLIDVHTGSLSRTNLPQIRADLTNPHVAELAEKMGSIVVLQSGGAKGTLRRAATEAGIPAVTLETGAPNNLQKEAVEQGVKSILAALSSLGFTAPRSRWRRSQEPIYYKSTWIRAKEGGILFSKVELGDAVGKGSVLGLLSDPITNKITEIVAPFEGRVIGMALNQVMYPGFAAYHIGLKSSAVEAAEPTPLIPEEGEELSLDDVHDDIEADEAVSEPTAQADTEDAKPEAEKETISEMSLPTIDVDKKK